MKLTASTATTASRVFDEIAELGIAFVTDGLVQRDRLTRVLLDLQHLLRRDVHFLGQLFGRGLAAQVLQQLALDAAELVDHLDHVHRNADGAGLVGHRAGDRLPDPPGGVGGELVTLCVVELFDRADQAEVALLDQVEERHTAARVALGQRDDETQVRFQQVVFRAVAVAADPRHVAALRGGQLLALLRDLGHQLRGVQPRLDALGELDLFLGIEQRDLADLLEIGTHRVGRSGELGVLAGLPQRLGLLFVPDEVSGCLVLLARFGDLVVVGWCGHHYGGSLRSGLGARGGLVVADLEVLQREIGLVYLEVVAGLGFELVVALDLVCDVCVDRARFGRGGLLRAAAGGGGGSAALAPRDAAAPWLRSAAFAGLAAVRVFVAVPDAAFAGVVLVARFAGADPLADFAAGAFLAGVLVAVRFTGSSVAGRAFVAATYTLSILQIPMGTVVHHRKASAMSNVGG